jgi:hypothetical protein
MKRPTSHHVARELAHSRPDKHLAKGFTATDVARAHAKELALARKRADRRAKRKAKKRAK